MGWSIVIFPHEEDSNPSASFLLFLLRLESGSKPLCIARLIGLSFPGDGQIVLLDIVRNRRTSDDKGAFAHFDRSDQIHVASDERIVLNLCQMLVKPVIVNRNRAAAYVDVLSDFRIAYVAKMRNLGAFPQSGIL